MKAILAAILVVGLLCAAILAGAYLAGHAIKHESSQTPNTTKK